MQGTKAIAQTLILVFVVTVLGELAAVGAHIFDLSGGQWKGIAAAGIAALIAFAYKWLNPFVKDYGIGAE